jgi:hypothetical protein
LANVDGGEYILGFVSGPTIEPGTGNIIGDGYILKVNIIAPYPEVADGKQPKINDGKYEVNGRQEQFSIINHKANDNSKISIAIDNELAGELNIQSGYMNTTRTSGDNYDIEFNFELSDGSTFVSSYSGPIEMRHMNLISTNYSDRDCYMRGGGGVLNAWGQDIASPDGSWNWDCWLWGDGITWDAYNRDHVGYGDLMRISLFAGPAENNALLPTGTFPIGGSYTANTALWGGWDNDAKVMDGMWGSWYLDFTNNDKDENGTRIEGEYGALISGTIEVQYNPDTQIYNIIIDAYDDAGNKIDVDFEGPIGTNVVM